MKKFIFLYLTINFSLNLLSFEFPEREYPLQFPPTIEDMQEDKIFGNMIDDLEIDSNFMHNDLFETINLFDTQINQEQFYPQIRETDSQLKILPNEPNTQFKEVKIDWSIICNLCNCNFKSERELLHHNLQTHKSCNKCNSLKFKTKKECNEHYTKTHSPRAKLNKLDLPIEKIGICKLCNKKFLDKNYVHKHCIRVHQKCLRCNRLFKSQQDAFKHKKKYHSISKTTDKSKYVSCNLCFKKIYNNANLIRHGYNIHSICFICNDKIVRSKEENMNHYIKIHSRQAKME